jgi:hypothetical protein
MEALKQSQNMKVIFLLIIFFSLSDCFAWSLFGPRSYDDCILENMKGVTNKEASLQIQIACESKFPGDEPKKCKMRELTKAEIGKISAEAEVSNYSSPYLSASLHNGNGSTSIDEITIVLSADNIKPPQEYKLYMRFPISPQSSGEAGISVQVAPKKNMQWSLKSIKTCSK